MNILNILNNKELRGYLGAGTIFFFGYGLAAVFGLCGNTRQKQRHF